MGDSSAAALNVDSDDLNSFFSLSPSVTAAQRPHYELSAIQRKILGLIQFDARRSTPDLAKALGVREGSVRYALQALRDNHIIYQSPLIDLSKLGFALHGLLISLDTKDRIKIERVRSYLSTAPQVVFASEVGGRYQFSFAFVTRTASGIAQFMMSLEKAIGDIILDKQLATHLWSADFRADYISQSKGEQRSLRFGGSTQIEKIDLADHQILVAMTAPDFTSVSGVARAVKLPVSTVEFRLKRMEERGIILAYRNLICSGRLGVQRFWMNIVVKGSAGSFAEDFFNYCNSNPFVRYASASVGGWDFDIGFDAPNAPVTATIIEDINRAFGARILSATTVPLFKTARYAAYPFTQHPESYY